MNVVKDLKADSECHLMVLKKERKSTQGHSQTREESAYMNNSHDDTHLHFQTITKDQSVVRSVPSWINSERVSIRSLDSFYYISNVEDCRPSESRRSQV